MKNKMGYLAIALAGFILAGAFLFFGLFAGWESFLEDRLYAAKPISDEIVIIAIDNQSLNQIGQWPWPRKVFADLILKLEKEKPLAVGLDVMFAEKSSLGQTDDLSLSQMLAQVDFPIILPVEAERVLINQPNKAYSENFIFPLPDFQKQKNVSMGQVNLIADPDGVVRRFPLVITDSQQQKIYAFGYELVKKSGRPIPLEKILDNLNRLVYAAPAGAIRRLPFWRLLADEPLNLQDKIVLIGATAADLHDFQNTPLGRGEAMAGVEVQANIVNMLLLGYRFQPLNQWIFFSWLFLAALIPALIFIIFKSAIKPLLICVILGLVYLIAIIWLFQNGIVVNVIYLNLSWILSVAFLFIYRYFIIEKEKRQIKNIFAKYVSPAVLDEILKNPRQVILGGEEKEMTILFSDIRGFTTMSEGLKPKELIRIINNYFTAMTEEILKYDGVIDKYIGDAIMAFWGAPLDDMNHAEKALKAAMAMVNRLKKVNEEFAARGDPEINIGVGLYTGPAVVGNVGSKLRVNYTVLGDTVNTASRLEGQTKDYGVKIILGENTKNKIKGDYNFKFLDSVKVKGKEEAVNIYTVIP